MKGSINITATHVSEKQDLVSMVDEWASTRDGKHDVYYGQKMECKYDKNAIKDWKAW